MCSCAGPGRADALLYVQLDNKNVVIFVWGDFPYA